ncbi:Suppressor of tumorigenicity 7 protein [Homalodisca vitripennis]|nr:Suppressor of tumorigenicity 7 protein [Homalodisca vitripennis]
MQTAWRERNPLARVKAAREALEKNPDCAPAYILLAEEEATTIVDAEKMLKQALRAAELNYRNSQQNQHQGASMEVLHRRDTNVLIYIRRRLAMCARKLGKLKEAVKMFRDVSLQTTFFFPKQRIHYLSHLCPSVYCFCYCFPVC